jgi:hypothetical protein
VTLIILFDRVIFKLNFLSKTLGEFKFVMQFYNLFILDNFVQIVENIVNYGSTLILVSCKKLGSLTR